MAHTIHTGNRGLTAGPVRVPTNEEVEKLSAKVIIVTTQAEMDAVAKDFAGEVEIRSLPGKWIRVPSGLWVRAYDSSQVTAYDSSQVTAYDSSQVRACDSSQVTAYDSSQVTAYGSSQVRAYDSSQVTAYDSSQVTAYDSSQVTAYGSSQVRAYGSSQVTARGNTQILRLSKRAVLTATGNSRIVVPPRTAEEYCDYYDIEVQDGKAILVKAVNADLTSFYDGVAKVRYQIGETLLHTCDPSVEVECGDGLHVAHKDWAVRFGLDRDPNGFRLLECSVPLDKIVVPESGDGKVRTSELTVLREIPREEWGFYSTWRA